MPEARTVTAADVSAALGARVREIRAGRGMTLRDLAARLGVSPATMSAVENGRTGISAVRLARVAELLETPIEVLMAPSRSVDTGSSGVKAATESSHAGAAFDWRAYSPIPLDPPLAAALSAFLEIGYHGATMRDIARRAHLSVPGVYHHYASKQEMLVAILDLTMEELLTRCREAKSEGRDPMERFSNLIESLALFHTHRRELGFVGASEMRSLEPAARERVTRQRTSVQRMVDEEVEQAREDGVFGTDQPREAARAVVTMCTALAQWFSPAGRATAEQVAEQYVGFALALVRYNGETPRPS